MPHSLPNQRERDKGLGSSPHISTLMMTLLPGHLPSFPCIYYIQNTPSLMLQSCIGLCGGHRLWSTTINMDRVLTKRLPFNQDTTLKSYPLNNVFSISMNPNPNFLHECPWCSLCRHTIVWSSAPLQPRLLTEGNQW